MAYFALAVWILLILLVGLLVLWAAGKEKDSSFLSSLIPDSPAWQKRKRKEEEEKKGKARIAGSFKIPPSSPPLPQPEGRKVLATSSSVIEVKSLRPRTSPPLPKA